MSDLIKWFREETEANISHPVFIAATLHYRFVRIHPFDDGNGRISRLLMNYVFYYYGLPPVIIKSDDKKSYLAALHDADTGNISSFISYISEQLIESLNLYIKAASGQQIEEDDDWKKEFEVLKTSLEAVETIEVVKSSDSIKEVMKNSIIPLFKFIIDELKVYEDLFIDNSIYWSEYNGESIQWKYMFDWDSLVDNSEKSSLITTGFYTSIDYNKFKKQSHEQFDISILSLVTFNEYDYEFQLIEFDTKYKKLYTNVFTLEDKKSIVKVYGSYINSIIKAKVRK